MCIGSYLLMCDMLLLSDRPTRQDGPTIVADSYPCTNFSSVIAVVYLYPCKHEQFAVLLHDH